MTQSEFDVQVIEMKQQYANELRGIKKMQEEVNEELAAKKRMMQGMQQECSKLRQQKYMLAQCRLEIEKKWGGEISAFIKEHLGKNTSNLAEADTLNIMYELRRRGFHGIVHKFSEDGTTIEKQFDLSKEEWGAEKKS